MRGKKRKEREREREREREKIKENSLLVNIKEKMYIRKKQQRRTTTKQRDFESLPRSLYSLPPGLSPTPCFFSFS
jgi:hypothetical protein